MERGVREAPQPSQSRMQPHAEYPSATDPQKPAEIGHPDRLSRSTNRAAIYLRVSRDDQTTEHQRFVLARVAEHCGWMIVQNYEDQGISGAKGWNQRPAFDRMLKETVRRPFDILMVWSIDRLGSSVLHVANALAEPDAAGVALYSSTAPAEWPRNDPRRQACSMDRSGRSSAAGSTPGWTVSGRRARSSDAERYLPRSRQQSASIRAPGMAPQGGGNGRRWKWDRAAGEAGDGWAASRNAAMLGSS